ncbi:unnamed protein product [Eruca vesicaria subsp. sativa]|uniref:GRF-type domain-containing protein n=1 Tax=Eruca vesicaria subsp. sativa TaxID=29727 RepID=A0ABC8KRC5_ERUVS|nr:unnamed protein product [Eruca vesicaria subsp. sativa]
MSAVPSHCWCGHKVDIFLSRTPRNPGRRFYRCIIALQRPGESHLFKWVDESILADIHRVDSTQQELITQVQDLRQTLEQHLTVHEEGHTGKEEVFQYYDLLWFYGRPTTKNTN